MKSLQDYFDAEIRLLSHIDLARVDQVTALLKRARKEHRRIFLFGNGGSGSTASHFACDLGKGTIKPSLERFRVIALNDSMPTLTAYANDMGYEHVFSEPLLSLAEKGDVAIAFTGSGNSMNVVRGMEMADKCGLVTVGFTGFAGGKVQDLVQYHVNVPSDLMGMIEDVHLVMTHGMCEVLKIEHGDDHGS